MPLVPPTPQWYVKLPFDIVLPEAFNTQAEAEHEAKRRGGVAFLEEIITDVDLSEGKAPLFTFRVYDPAYGNPSIHDVQWELPVLLMAYRESIIMQATFKPEDDPRIGVLSAAWYRHPVGAIVVAPDINFIMGTRFAVSRQPVPWSATA